MEQVLLLQNATIDRDGRNLLSNVNLSMSRSEFVYLIGKTGSGKSSLLKTLWGEIPLMSGTGSIVGMDLGSLTPRKVTELRRKIGIVFQEFHLFDDWTLFENLSFVLEATGWKDKGEIANRISQVLGDVELARYMDTKAGQLSGGEQQRLVIARSILNNPEIILADEPTGNLDPETSYEILQLLRTLAMRYNTAILMATHDREILRRFPGRVYLCQNTAVIEME